MENNDSKVTSVIEGAPVRGTVGRDRAIGAILLKAVVVAGYNLCEFIHQIGNIDADQEPDLEVVPMNVTNVLEGLTRRISDRASQSMTITMRSLVSSKAGF